MTQGVHGDHEELITRTDLDRAIEYSTLRIKFWVISGVLANFLILTGVMAPVIFYLGQIDSQLKVERATTELARSRK